jgi:hypothetical protein
MTSVSPPFNRSRCRAGTSAHECVPSTPENETPSVSTGFLGVKHCLVGLEQRASQPGVDRKAGNADRRADVHFFSARTVRMQTTVRVGNARAKPFRAAELIAAVARDDIGGIGRCRAQQNREVPQGYAA